MKAHFFACAAALALAGCGYTAPNNVSENEYYSSYEWLNACTPYNVRQGKCSDHSIGGAEKAGYHVAYTSQYDYDARRAKKAARRY